MKYEELKGTARPVSESQDPHVLSEMQRCDAIYGLEVRERRVVQFRRKAVEGNKDMPLGRSMAFTFDRDKGEYEALLATATMALGEHAVVQEW